MNIDTKKHKEFEVLTKLTYKNKTNCSHEGWKEIEHFENPKTGYYAKVFKKNNQIAISYRGTNITEMADFKNDFELLQNNIPSQIKDAFATYKTISKKYPHSNITHIGYSLGGSIAIYMSGWTNKEAITFGAYGNDKMNAVFKDKNPSVINYGRPKDIVFHKGINNLPGKIFIVDKYNSNSQTEFGKLHSDKHKLGNLYEHISDFGDLNDIIEYFPKKNYEYIPYLKNPHYPLKGNISYEYYPDEIFDIKNRVLHRNEIDIETADKELIDLYADQLLDDYIPEKGELDMRVFAGDLIYVNNYQRQDGTKVSGYYRRRSAK